MQDNLDVAIDAEFLRKSNVTGAKIHATTLGKIRNKMMTNPDPVRPKAKNKWLETCEVDGVRYGVTCHRLGNVAVIKNAKRLRKL
jgi:hypothetical protein